MRKLYLTYPKSQTLSDFLSWSQYIELLKIDDPLERSFYEKEAESEHWGVRELKRQMKSMLFHRLALSTNREDSCSGQEPQGRTVSFVPDFRKSPAVSPFKAESGLSLRHSGKPPGTKPHNKKRPQSQMKLRFLFLSFNQIYGAATTAL